MRSAHTIPVTFGLLLCLGATSQAGHFVGARPGVRRSSEARAAAVTRPAADTLLRDTLANGLRVVIIRDTLAPMVTTEITYLTGAYETPSGFPGDAHALEHMMFRGSNGLSGAQLNELTGKMGGDNNAFTTNDATQYYFVAPSAYLAILLHIEASRMRGAALSDSDWALERGAIEQEVSRDISDPDYLAFERAEADLFGGTGYELDPLGTRPTFDSTTAAGLRAFYDAWYQPNNAIFVIAGDVDPRATLAQVKQLFDTIPSRPTPQRRSLDLGPIRPDTIRSTTPAGTGSVEFIFRMPGEQSPDYAAAQILMDALNNARSSLSALQVRGKVLSAYAYNNAFSYGGMGEVAVEFPKGGDAGRAEADLDSVLADVVEHGVPADLIEAARQSELAQAEFRKNSVVGLAATWSDALAWQGLDSPAEADRRIRSVTAADVDRLARQYLQPSGRVVVVLTPSETGTRPPNSTGFGGTESFAGNDKLDVPLPDWAAAPLTTLEMPHWTLAPVTMKLANGITLVVQPEKISRTVTVVGYVDHDDHLEEPPGQDGVGRLLGSLFDYGTTTLDRDAFHKALDAIAATEDGGARFRLSVLSEHFDRGVQLLADNELHPALPQEGFAVQQQSLARSLAGQLQSPQYKMNRALLSALYPAGDPALREATPATVDSLTLQDARAYYARTYRPDLATIVVVGDVTPADARATIEKYFGHWQASGPKPEVVPGQVPPNPPGYTVVPNAFASQDEVLMAQTLPLNLSSPDRYALELGNDVLGGNGFASRLMVDVRVRHGYAYGAYSFLQFTRSRALFIVEYGSDSDKVAPVDALVSHDVHAMQDSLIKPEELTNARQYEIRSIPVSVSSVGRIANQLLTWSYNGQPLDEPMVAARHYLTLTAPEIRAAFTKYLDVNHLVQVVQGPTPGAH